MSGQNIRFDIKHYKTLPSTNDELKVLAENGAKEGTVLIADEQTAGKGRQGRSFFSPMDTGIYMSILLKPSLPAKDSLFITTAAAVAVAQALRSETGLDARIKWVNDIYISERKVCGILAEASLSETGGLRYVVLGIGINVTPPKQGFPSDIKDIAGALIGEGYDRTEKKTAFTPSEANGAQDIKQRIIDAVLKRFDELYTSFVDSNFNKSVIADPYRSLNAVTGRDIFILEEAGPVPAHADGIDNDCRLLVTLPDGTKRTLSSGEVSIRFK